MSSPLISVIVPVYNKKKYLRRCLECLLGQDYKNLEIILVDDGSTDGSSEVIREFSQRYGIIRSFFQKNSGAASARNYGMRVAKGEYLCFVDSDDYVFDNYISYMYKILQATKADCSICSAYKLGENEGYEYQSKEDKYFIYNQPS